MTSGPAARAALGLLGALVLLAATAAPAAADAPRPTDYRSTVTEVSPALPDGAEVRVVGGDSLLELSLPLGHTAVVADYASSGDEEPVPYLRFDADGTVRRNELAVATTANESRFGTSGRVPDPDAPPQWETVATDGTYAWHDHRIHWMSPTAPRAVDEDGRVDLGGDDGTWTVPLTVDGNATLITGTLVLEAPPSPVGPSVASLVALALTVGLGWRFGLRAGAAVGAAAGLPSLLVALATWRAVPPGAGASAIPVVVTAVAVLAGLIGVLPFAKVRLPAVAATAAALLGWGVVRFSVLTRAVLPTTLDPWLDRVATATAIGVGLALALLLVGLPAPQRRRPARPEVTASPTA